MQGLGGAQKMQVSLYIGLPVQVNGGEGLFQHVLDAMKLAGGKELIVRGVLAEGQPHATDIIAGVAPVALGRGVAKGQMPLLAGFDGGGGPADLAGDEVLTPSRGFVVVGDAIDGKEAMSIPVDGHHSGSKGLGAPVRIDWGDGGIFRLGHLLGPAEDLAGSGMKKTRRMGQVANDL